MRVSPSSAYEKKDHQRREDVLGKAVIQFLQPVRLEKGS